MKVWLEISWFAVFFQEYVWNKCFKSKSQYVACNFFPQIPWKGRCHILIIFYKISTNLKQQCSILDSKSYSIVDFWEFKVPSDIIVVPLQPVLLYYKIFSSYPLQCPFPPNSKKSCQTYYARQEHTFFKKNKL